MVFPSPGCLTCKKRRLKCDSVRPSCTRCNRSKRLCHWDSTEGAVWKNENNFAQGQPRRPRQRAITRRPRNPLPTTPQPLPLHSLSLPLENYAFNYWLTNFTIWPKQPRDGEVRNEYGAYALCFWNSSPQDSTLRLSLSALSLVIFGRAMHSKKAFESAHYFYSRSIRSMRKEIANLSDQTIDQLLVATLIMATYDNIMHSDAKNSILGLSPSGSSVRNSLSVSSPDIGHCKGAMGLLQVRKEQGWTQNIHIHSFAQRLIVRSCLLQGIGIPEWLQNPDLYDPKDPLRGLDLLLARVATLRSNALNVLREGNLISQAHIEKLRKISTEAAQLDAAFNFWVLSLPEEWRFSVLRFGNVDDQATRDLLYDNTTHVYSTHNHAAVWNRYRAGRLISNGTHLRLLSALPEDETTRKEIEKYQVIISSIATELCHSVSFFFSRYHGQLDTVDLNGSSCMEIEKDMSPMTAYLLAWPLTIALRTKFVPESQKQWLQPKLEMFARYMGANLLTYIVNEGKVLF